MLQIQEVYFHQLNAVTEAKYSKWIHWIENEDQDRRCNVHIFGSWFYSENEKIHSSVCWSVWLGAINQFSIPFLLGLVSSGLPFHTDVVKGAEEADSMFITYENKKWREWLVLFYGWQAPNIVLIRCLQVTQQMFHRWYLQKTAGREVRHQWGSMVSALADLTSPKPLLWQ